MLESCQHAAFDVFPGEAAVHVVGERFSEFFAGLAAEAVVAATASGAAGFEQAVAGGKAGEDLAGAVERTLADPGRLCGADLPVAGEVVDDEEVIDGEIRVLPDQLDKFGGGLLTFDGDRDGLARGGVNGRLLTLREQIAEGAGNAKVGGIGEAYLASAPKSAG